MPFQLHYCTCLVIKVRMEICTHTIYTTYMQTFLNKWANKTFLQPHFDEVGFRSVESDKLF